MRSLDNVLEQNLKWADKTCQDKPEFFKHLAEKQVPEILWIGCSDSRVPPDTILDLTPGAIFSHRNIANQVIADDLNCQSVIQYAVQALKVKHIVVCGHHGCGGVAAAMNDPSLGQIEEWLNHIREVYIAHADEVNKLDNLEDRQNRLCELNTIEQVAKVCESPFVKQAWAAGQKLHVRGWIFEPKDGLLRDLNVTTLGPDN